MKEEEVQINHFYSWFKILKFVSLGGTVNYNFGKITTQASNQMKT